MSYDVVVIGAGVAGMVAARRAQQLGGQPIVLDKAPDRALGLDPGSNSRKSGGLFHAAYRDPRRWSADDLFANLLDKTDGHARIDVARAWAGNVVRGLDFLAREGVAIGRDGELEYQWNALLPPMTVFYDLEWQGRGPDLLLTRMRSTFEEFGGLYWSNSQAVDMVIDRGGVAGVVVQHADGTRATVDAKRVIMADGGFQANRELVARYITSEYVVNGTHLNTGDCLRMAMAIGASTMNLDAFYGHIRVWDAQADPDRLFRYPSPRDVVNEAMVVDARSKRIGSETVGKPEGVELIAISIAHCDTPGGCWVVFDDRTWQSTATNGRLPMNPTIANMQGPLKAADSIEQLADATGLPVDALCASVRSFNQFCTQGTPLDPPRAERTRPITEPPFFAIPIITGITFTMGGVVVNGHAQVLDAHETPIPGLYAAGGTMGGLQGGPRNGYSGGWSEATTFGLLAAEHAMS